MRQARLGLQETQQPEKSPPRAEEMFECYTTIPSPRADVGDPSIRVEIFLNSLTFKNNIPSWSIPGVLGLFLYLNEALRDNLLIVINLN